MKVEYNLGNEIILEKILMKVYYVIVFLKIFFISDAKVLGTDTVIVLVDYCRFFVIKNNNESWPPLLSVPTKMVVIYINIFLTSYL